MVEDGGAFTVPYTVEEEEKNMEKNRMEVEEKEEKSQNDSTENKERAERLGKSFWGK